MIILLTLHSQPLPSTLASFHLHASGSVAIVGNKIEFTPDSAFDALNTGDTATVVVNYTMQDNEGASSSSTVTITVNGTNDTPLAVADLASTDEDTKVTVDALANDTDPDSNDNPTNFTLTAASINAGTPPSEPQVLLRLSVTKLNSLPIALLMHSIPGIPLRLLSIIRCRIMKAPQAVQLSPSRSMALTIRPCCCRFSINREDTKVTVDALANDTDPDSNDNPTNFTLTAASINAGSSTFGASGSVAIVGNKIEFLPIALLMHSIPEIPLRLLSIIRCRIMRRLKRSTVTIINGTNDTPLAVADLASTDEDTKVTVDALANDTDPDSNDNPLTLHSQPLPSTLAAPPQVLLRLSVTKLNSLPIALLMHSIPGIPLRLLSIIRCRIMKVPQAVQLSPSRSMVLTIPPLLSPI
ncbi:MAG: Ig-like domain-containing protein [Gammaproteobacteria bacterium]